MFSSFHKYEFVAEIFPIERIISQLEMRQTAFMLTAILYLRQKALDWELLLY
jgi:hypothetical protein